MQAAQITKYMPIARNVVRYGAGALIGTDAANIMAGNPDLVSLVALGIGLAVEAFYGFAKRKGWAT